MVPYRSSNMQWRTVRLAAYHKCTTPLSVLLISALPQNINLYSIYTIMMLSMKGDRNSSKPRQAILPTARVACGGGSVSVPVRYRLSFDDTSKFPEQYQSWTLLNGTLPQVFRYVDSKHGGHSELPLSPSLHSYCSHHLDPPLLCTQSPPPKV